MRERSFKNPKSYSNLSIWTLKISLIFFKELTQKIYLRKEVIRQRGFRRPVFVKIFFHFFKNILIMEFINFWKLWDKKDLR